MMMQTTTKARLELHPGVQNLPLRARSVLLLAERRMPAQALARLFNGMGEQIVGELFEQGYLAPADREPPAPPAAPDLETG
ncbi:hypothetical protein [Ramlibacter sp.]|uniref:hypothetical protein n=1 Tax=Ramlibacter sp. TaxID=1917967 RepID=UPI002BB735B5|nr:hypothetical protein [Ramlibacter sp.]HWI82373.1 hypothetical protein [Ramlibacter sp.]